MLLISDEPFRAGDPKVRKRYVLLVEGVQEKRGEVLIFSCLHESGQRTYRGIDETIVLMLVSTKLNQISGIVAILTFPLDIKIVEALARENIQEYSCHLCVLLLLEHDASGM